ncbi:hypothetical protein CFOL_v3_04096 [Cephalotus follicularis]|uniref:Uncharacterized protein n=1 Tax=Cephalotus follicularis TaxID=3775 RepID=A0A1Q3AXS7_CEPFO|nr:hypothetical protein CFOL_v3_04096 [Cephalotus follicularis]
MYNQCRSPSSIKEYKLSKSSICCFRTTFHDESGSSSSSASLTTRSSAYTWLKSTAHDLEIKDKCQNLIARISKKIRKHHRQRHHYLSIDFRYDPLSYSLNFEDEQSRVHEYPLCFTSRLPISPDRVFAAKCGDTPVCSERSLVIARVRISDMQSPFQGKSLAQPTHDYNKES